MAPMKLHGYRVSSCTMRVAVCLIEKNIPYEFVPVDLFKNEQRNPSFLQLNPFGEVPVFEDGDLILFESRAITRYLEENYADCGTELLPKDPKKRAIVTTWMEVETQKYDAAAYKLMKELRLKPMWGMTTDEAAVEEFQAQLATVLDIYEARLAESKYLGGDSFSLADLHHLPNLKFLMATKVKPLLFDSRPHVSAWVADITSRPSWLKVVSM